MNKNDAYGVYPTMITPYKSDGSVDLDTAEKYVRHYFSKGCAGVFAICQSSEIWKLDLSERIALNKTVYKVAGELRKESGRRFNVVSSGHVGGTIEEQAYELSKIAETGTDAIILISNRLDMGNEGDDVWLKNAEKLLKLLPEDVNLGVYECPYPYKKLLSQRTLSWCRDTGRFRFMKDTCCDIKTIKERLDILRGSDFMLMNANSQTLLESLRYGACGYSSVMANFHPELYVWLCNNIKHERAEEMQQFLGTLAFTEAGLPYPLSAKYNMCLEGIPTENVSRVQDSEKLTDYVKDCVAQMRNLTVSYPKLLGIKGD